MISYDLGIILKLQLKWIITKDSQAGGSTLGKQKVLRTQSAEDHFASENINKIMQTRNFLTLLSAISLWPQEKSIYVTVLVQ